MISCTCITYLFKLVLCEVLLLSHSCREKQLVCYKKEIWTHLRMCLVIGHQEQVVVYFPLRVEVVKTELIHRRQLGFRETVSSQASLLKPLSASCLLFHFQTAMVIHHWLLHPSLLPAINHKVGQNHQMQVKRLPYHCNLNKML